MIIERLCKQKGSNTTGFYVDVGANDPDRLSNTKRFYKMGWSGINIDANPNSIRRLSDARPRDINLNVGVSDYRGTCLFYVMFPPTVSTFDPKSCARAKKLGCKLLTTLSVETMPLREIFDKYWPTDREVDFLSIDIEGLDVEAVESNDWSKYRPKVICIEAPTIYHHDIPKQNSCRLVKYFDAVDYDLAYHNGMDAFFVRRN